MALRLSFTGSLSALSDFVLLERTFMFVERIKGMLGSFLLKVRISVCVVF
jgi:hypothetical protein